MGRERNAERNIPNLSDSKRDGEKFLLSDLQDSLNAARQFPV